MLPRSNSKEGAVGAAVVISERLFVLLCIVEQTGVPLQSHTVRMCSDAAKDKNLACSSLVGRAHHKIKQFFPGAPYIFFLSSLQ